MNASGLIAAAFARCPAVEPRSLEDFLGTLLDEDLTALAQLPGTPGQVMSAQFTHYVRSSVVLTETIRRCREPADQLIRLVLRLRSARGRCKSINIRSPDGAPASSRQAVAV